MFLQTIEHVQDPDAVMDAIREQIGPGGVAYVSTPNVLTLAPKGAERSGNPWHVHEYRAGGVRRAVLAPLLERRPAGALPRAQAARPPVGDRARALGRRPRALRFTKPFYARFTPAISVRDFALRRGRLERALDLLAVLRP